MISFKSEYNQLNLEHASSAACVPLSKLKYIKNERKSLMDIKVMELSKSIYEQEIEEGLVFGFGKNMEFDDLISFLENKYINSKFLKLKNNIDPIILINNSLYDGWKRCILAFALGQMEVECACFESIVFDNYLYLTEPSKISEAEENLSNIKINYSIEWLNGGLLIYCTSKEDVRQIANILNIK